ncbi:hypothetical protein [Agathobaculum sp.]|uniref:hypothetical protein n=1 Tax=Agathobaculum sp. TaxID=2048138 RepID=UPI003521DA5A
MTGNSIIYGDRTFTNLDVKEGRTTSERSPIGDVLTIDTLEFDVVSDDTTLTDFIRNTPLIFFHDDEQMGIFYVQKISRTSINTYHFACTSTVGLLDETYHDGGIYTGETVKEVCEDICSPLTVYVKTNLQNIKLYGWLPIATRRENLTQVLFAIGATFKVDFDGAIRIEGLWSGEASAIDAGEIYASGTVDYATPVTEVIVTEHAYSQSATETTELFKGTTSAGDKITFDEPCYDLAASGFSILASGANWATVSAGSGVLTGKKYTHVTRQVMQQIKPKTRELVTQSDNTVKVENATLVSLVNATAVAERLAEYYSHNERINYKIATKRETPGDVVKIAHPYGGTVSGCIESADITVSGKLAAEESVLIDYFPPDIGVQEYYDTVEVLTKDGTWAVPENVTSIRVVLIGGGSGGSSGCEGEDGKNVYNGGAGGKGGIAGAGGEGGKVYSVEMDVTPGTNYAVQIGAGGKGGVYSADGSVAGTSGVQTKFGSLSSENGSSSDIGFADPVNNQFYAQVGDDGIKGGDGGNGGEANYTSDDSKVRAGKDGGNALGYAGGKGASGSGGKHDGQIGVSGGGGGGGAAMGNAGGDGNVGRLKWAHFDITEYQGYGWLANGGAGGSGGNATIIPNTPTMLGCGGGGGHGGGGGGGGGLTQAVSTWSHSGGSGGNGSSGGDGAPGCVLIYYRVYRASSSGRFVTRDGKGFNEKFTRKVVV